MDLKKIKTKKQINEELTKEHFRVAIFGSARIQAGDEIYQQVYDLGKSIGQHQFDIVTGGGPGLMEAANAGHMSGDKNNLAESIGIRIKLPFEQTKNRHLEIKKDYSRFSTRLDHFMMLSNVVVVVPGGIGTSLEFFYTWQLTQVGHISKIPIILVGQMWEKLLKWVRDYPLKNKLLNPADLDNVFIAKNNEEAMNIILKTNEEYKKNPTKSHKKYNIDD